MYCIISNLNKYSVITFFYTYIKIKILDELTKSLLAPCGNMNINILSNNIKTVEFDNIEVYRTIPHNNLKTNLDMVLNKIKSQIGVIFFSPSGFHAICDLMPKQLFNQIHVSIYNL